MMRVVKVDADSFCGIFTAYEIEAKWRKYTGLTPSGQLTKAEIRTENEVALGNDNRVFFTYEREAHALTLKDVADIFTNVGDVLIGRNGKTRVVCLLPKQSKR